MFNSIVQRSFVMALLSCSATAFAQEEAAPVNTPQTFSFDAQKSKVYVQVFKADTLLSGLAHDHVMLAKDIRASMSWAEDYSQCSVSMSLPVASLVVDSPEMRKLVGYDGAIKDSDRKKIRKNMLDDDQLDAEKFKTVTFESTSCEAKGDALKVSGRMTIKGKSRSLVVPLKVSSSEGGVRILGKFSVKGSDFGIAPFSAALGAVKNQDSLKFTLDIVARPK